MTIYLCNIDELYGIIIQSSSLPPPDNNAKRSSRERTSATFQPLSPRRFRDFYRKITTTVVPISDRWRTHIISYYFYKFYDDYLLVYEYNLPETCWWCTSSSPVTELLSVVRTHGQIVPTVSRERVRVVVNSNSRRRVCYYGRNGTHTNSAV